jgi:small subunit ribosomal protein S20
MAHHAAAKKSIRQTERRTAVNRARLSRVRNFIKKVESAIDAGDKKSAAAALKEAQPIVHRGVRASSRGSAHASRRSPKHRNSAAIVATAAKHSAAHAPHQESNLTPASVARQSMPAKNILELRDSCCVTRRSGVRVMTAA